MKRMFGSMAVAMTLLALPGIGSACGNGAVQFSDNFKTPDPGWGQSTSFVKIGGGQVQITPAVNTADFVYNQPLLYTQADACVSVAIGDLTKPGEMSGGLVFWIQDNTHYYIFTERANGTWFVTRFIANRWVPVANGKSDVIKTGANAVNEVEVRINGNAAEGWINGTKVVSFHGQPPDGGGALGLYGESENDRANTWTFHDFKVLKLPSP